MTVTVENISAAAAEQEAAGLVRQAFEEIFGEKADGVYFAPGRVNLIGEHIDYNGGHVFPCALTLGTYAAVRKRDDRVLRFYSMNFEQDGMITSSLDTFEAEPRDDWSRYAKGVVWAYRQAGYEMSSGIDFLCIGTIPNKSGLSSSASLEVVTGTALKDLFGWEDADQVKNACLGQKAENEFVGLNCGIMDQFASANGKVNAAVLLDCATLAYEHVPLDLGTAKLVIVNTNKPHELTESAYNERRAECERSLELLQSLKPGLKALCELTEEEFLELSPILRKEPNGEYLYRRAYHAVTEELRTQKGVLSLRAGDLKQFGKLMNGSHISLQHNYAVSCRELDILAETAWNVPGTIGARMTGGGFGGCTVNIVEGEAVEDFIETVGKAYRKTVGYDASFYVVTAGDGAHRVEI